LELEFELAKNSTKGLVTVTTPKGIIKLTSTAVQFEGFAKSLGILGHAATTVNVISDIHSYKSGEISGTRFIYRTFGNTTSLFSSVIADAIIGAEIGEGGGPAGAALGIFIGVSFSLGEKAYDEIIAPAPDFIHNWIFDTIDRINSALGHYMPN
jgi:hypothetical protein